MWWCPCIYIRLANQPYPNNRGQIVRVGQCPLCDVGSINGKASILISTLKNRSQSLYVGLYLGLSFKKLGETIA